MRAARTMVALLGAAGVLLTGCGGAEGQRGTFVAVDDTGLRDTPIEDGMLVVIPRDAAHGLLSAEDADPDALRYGGGEITRAQVAEASGDLVPVSDGRFALEVPPGEYYLCYARHGVGRGETATDGCGLVALTEDSDLAATIGEGGFWVHVAE